MKIYLVSLATGILVGLIYALLQVRSPAPPAIALIGLLGMHITGVPGKPAPQGAAVEPPPPADRTA